MRMALWLLAALAAVAALASVAQHVRYLETRREVVHDRQPILHSADAFHVVTLLALAPGGDLLVAVRDLVRATESAGATVVYAGKVLTTALVSEQIPRADWDAFVLAQFPSREAYDRAASEAEYRAVREGLSASYAMGMQRSPWANAAIPLLLLVRRAFDVLSGTPARYPFTPSEGEPPTGVAERRGRVVEALMENREYGSDAVVILNFVAAGDAAQREANAGYGAAMMSLMAEIGNGPVHMGRAVTIEGNAHFDQVVIVYYPGVQYFADLIRSEFFASIVGGKQLADSLSAPTVPLLPHL